MHTGGEQLHQGDHYIVALIDHDRLRQLADALAAVTPKFISESIGLLLMTTRSPATRSCRNGHVAVFTQLTEFEAGQPKTTLGRENGSGSCMKLFLECSQTRDSRRNR